MAKVYKQIDSWFKERGYKSVGTGARMDRGFVIKKNDLLFELFISATSMQDDLYYSTQVVYAAMLPQLGDLHLALTHNSSVAGTPIGAFKGNFATFLNYVPDYCGFPWVMKFQYLEKTTIGNHWEELLTQLDQDLPIAWSELADAKDLYAAVEHGTYWGWARASEVYGKLFVLLYQKRWDEALAHVCSWTVKDINIQELPPRPGRWTTQEELDNAIKVVVEYINKHRKD